MSGLSRRECSSFCSFCSSFIDCRLCSSSLVKSLLSSGINLSSSLIYKIININVKITNVKITNVNISKISSGIFDLSSKFSSGSFDFSKFSSGSFFKCSDGSEVSNYRV